MPKTVRQSLIEKGWEEKDIAQAENILYSEEKQEKHYGYLKSVSPIVYWMGLMVAIIGNMIIAVFLIPFLLVMTSIQLYVIIGTMGVVFGAMFNFLLRDIEHVDYKHHVIAGAFIPTLGAITIFVVVTVANAFATIIQSAHINVWLVSIIYVATFTTPYLIYKIDDLKNEKRHKGLAKVKTEADQIQPQEAEEQEQPEQQFVSHEEAWKVYQQRQAMADNKIHSEMLNKYKKFL